MIEFIDIIFGITSMQTRAKHGLDCRLIFLIKLNKH